MNNRCDSIEARAGARRPILAPRKVLGLAALLGGVGAAFPLAAQTEWTGLLDDDWFLPSNWTDGVPTASDDAEIDLDMPPAVIEIESASANDIRVGISATGELTVFNGASLDFRLLELGDSAGGEGILTVAGASVSGEDIIVGDAGTGVATFSGNTSLSGNGVVGFQDGATGSVTVTGLDAVWNMDFNLVVGSAGEGTVDIVNGARVSNFIGRIAQQATATGAVTVGGSGASWTNSDNLFIGDAGSGELIVGPGGEVTNVDGIVGNAAGSNGIVRPRFGGTWTTTGSLIVGRSGSGFVDVRDGSLTSAQLAVVGENADATGTIRVRESSGTWTHAGSPPNIGLRGRGLLEILAGGQVSATALSAAVETDSEGTLTIRGAGSQLDLTGAPGLVIGVSGSGSMTVADGGLVSNTEGIVASETGSTGAVTIDGGTWNNSETLAIGESAPGSMTILDGGVVTSALVGFVDPNAGYIGRFSNATGTVTIDGPGSAWIAEGSIGMSGTETAESMLLVSRGGRLDLTGGNRRLTLDQFPDQSARVVIGQNSAPGIIDAAEIHADEGTARLVFHHNAALHHFTDTGDATGTAPLISGVMQLEHIGSGTTVLPGDHTFTGPVSITNGRLAITGSISAPTTVSGSGTETGILGGNGSTGTVDVQDGGRIAPGDGTGAPGTLNTAELTLAPSAEVGMSLAQAGTVGSGVNDLIDINGNLVLDGALRVDDAGGFTQGTYRLITYSGALTDLGLEIAELPPGFDPALASIDTSTPGQVDLVVVGTPAISVDPDTLDYGEVETGTVSAPMTAGIGNTGTAPLEIDSISPVGLPFALDPASTDCPHGSFTLNPGEACTLGYVFSPTEEGDFSATVEIASNVSGSPHMLTLTGTGAAETAELTLSPSLLDFGEVEPDTTSDPMQAVIESTGSGPLEISLSRT